jgi:hypothetical protein
LKDDEVAEFADTIVWVRVRCTSMRG